MLENDIVIIGKAFLNSVLRQKNPFTQQHERVQKSTLIHLPIVHEKNSTVDGNMKALYGTLATYGHNWLHSINSAIRTSEDWYDTPVEDDLDKWEELDLPTFSLGLNFVPTREKFTIVCGDQLSVARVRTGMHRYHWERTHICIGE